MMNADIFVMTPEFEDRFEVVRLGGDLVIPADDDNRVLMLLAEVPVHQPELRS